MRSADRRFTIFRLCKCIAKTRRATFPPRHYMAIPLCQGTDLAVIAECFTCNTNGTYCNNIYTGEIQTSNYLRICPKMEFLCYSNDKYYMNDVTKNSKGNVLRRHQILNVEIKKCFSEKRFTGEINVKINETKKQPLRVRGYW